jgi:molybdenum cofactor synthesis domain-containing protein
MGKTVTAALVIIGNEILSGRTQDANLAFLGKSLNDIGIQMREVRVVPDVEEEIVAAVNAVRARYDYVFTTGGIGPTHDDITPESIAAAFGRKAVYHPEAYERLRAWYEANGREFTEMRKRMVLMPEGAELVNNEATIAPGFKVENVFVFAGVPQIMRAMFEATKPQLSGGDRVQSRSIGTRVVEGILAGPLKAIQERYPRADIGSYPFYNTPNGTGVSLVVRSTNPDDLKGAGDEIVAMIRDLDGEVLDDTLG